MAAEHFLGANGDSDVTETKEWLDSLDGVLHLVARDRARFLLTQLKSKAGRYGVDVPVHGQYSVHQHDSCCTSTDLSGQPRH